MINSSLKKVDTDVIIFHSQEYGKLYAHAWEVI